MEFQFLATTPQLNLLLSTDILSNGNNPPAVCRHLTKLYDNLAKLVFPKGSKMAFEMISKENEEHVKFKAPCCDCSGKVIKSTSF